MLVYQRVIQERGIPKKTTRMIHGMIGWDLFHTAQIGIVWFIWCQIVENGDIVIITYYNHSYDYNYSCDLLNIGINH